MEKEKKTAPVGVDTEVRILLEKKAGEPMKEPEIEAVGLNEVLAGVSMIIAQISKMSGVPLIGILGRITVGLLGLEADSGENVPQ